MMMFIENQLACNIEHKDIQIQYNQVIIQVLAWCYIYIYIWIQANNQTTIKIKIIRFINPMLIFKLYNGTYTIIFSTSTKDQFM